MKKYFFKQIYLIVSLFFVFTVYKLYSVEPPDLSFCYGQEGYECLNWSEWKYERIEGLYFEEYPYCEIVGEAFERYCIEDPTKRQFHIHWFMFWGEYPHCDACDELIDLVFNNDDDSEIKEHIKWANGQITKAFAKNELLNIVHDDYYVGQFNCGIGSLTWTYYFKGDCTMACLYTDNKNYYVYENVCSEQSCCGYRYTVCWDAENEEVECRRRKDRRIPKRMLYCTGTTL